MASIEVVELRGQQLDQSLPNNDSRAYSSSSSDDSYKRKRSNRSRSSKRYKRSRRYSRSRSRSPSYSRRRRYSHSRSPEISKKRYFGNREHPERSRCLGVFGLSVNTDERNIHEIFSRFGQIERVNIVYDAKTQRSRGFCFVYFKHEDDASQARRKCNGINIDERCIRVDYSITQRAHTPTPGQYMGLKKSPMRDDIRGSRRRESRRTRSPSPHRRHRSRHRR